MSKVWIKSNIDKNATHCYISKRLNSLYFVTNIWQITLEQHPHNKPNKHQKYPIYLLEQPKLGDKKIRLLIFFYNKLIRFIFVFTMRPLSEIGYPVFIMIYF